jgi:hypothetical protein
MILNKENVFAFILVLAAIGIVTTVIGLVIAFADGVQDYGETTSKDIEIGDVTSITFEGLGSLHIVQGDSPSLSITAGEKVIDSIKVSEEDGKLTIIEKRDNLKLFNFGLKEINRIDLVVTDLDRLEVTGVGDVNIPDFTTEKLHIVHTGVGQLNINIAANDLIVNQEGVGETNISGTATNHNVTFSGIGEYDARDLETEVTFIDMEGIGEATVWANTDLTIRKNGIGGIRYFGNPVTDIQSEGLGSVTKSTK